MVRNLLLCWSVSLGMLAGLAPPVLAQGWGSGPPGGWGSGGAGGWGSGNRWGGQIYGGAGGGSTDTGRVYLVNAGQVIIGWPAGTGRARITSSYQVRPSTAISVAGIPLQVTQLQRGWLISVNYTYEGTWETYRVANSITVQLAPLSGTVTRTSRTGLEIATTENGQATRYQMLSTPKTTLVGFGNRTLATLPRGTPVTCWCIGGSNPIVAMSIVVEPGAIPGNAPPPAPFPMPSGSPLQGGPDVQLPPPASQPAR